MKSIRNTWLGQMELVREIKNCPMAGWSTQRIRVYYKNGYIRIERNFSHARYPNYRRDVSWFKGSLEEAKSYNRMLKWY